MIFEETTSPDQYLSFNHPKMEFNTLAIIQARIASTRLPNKVLLDIAGQPALAHVLERTRRATTIDEVVDVEATEVDPP